ncbi:MAG: toprim domain-containing protein [Candidatus Bipolaricaulis sp.]|nr:toprim domain-containing protein [Candidatus Bipolaricaulis sp.]
MIRVESLQGDEYRCYCPLHDDKNASLYINLEKNKAICFAGCYAGNVVNLVAKVEKLPRIVAWQRIQEKAIFDYDKSCRSITRALSNVRIINDNTSTGIVWVSGDSTPYLLDRGFLRGTIRFWGIEYSEEIRHIRIPVFKKDHSLHCYSYRTIDKIEPKYLHPGFDKKSGLMFGEDKISPQPEIINLTEGQLDCIWLWQNGFVNSLAFLGLPTFNQIEKLIAFGKKFRLCFDNDEAGRNYARKGNERINELGGKCLRIKIPDGKKDVQELSHEELVRAMKGK